MREWWNSYVVGSLKISAVSCMVPVSCYQAHHYKLAGQQTSVTVSNYIAR